MPLPDERPRRAHRSGCARRGPWGSVTAGRRPPRDQNSLRDHVAVLVNVLYDLERLVDAHGSDGCLEVRGRAVGRRNATAQADGTVSLVRNGDGHGVARDRVRDGDDITLDLCLAHEANVIARRGKDEQAGLGPVGVGDLVDPLVARVGPHVGLGDLVLGNREVTCLASIRVLGAGARAGTGVARAGTRILA